MWMEGSTAVLSSPNSELLIFLPAPPADLNSQRTRLPSSTEHRWCHIPHSSVALMAQQPFIALLGGKLADVDLFQPQECADPMEKSMIEPLTIIKRQEISFNY